MSESDDSLKQKLRQIFNLKYFANNTQKEAVKKILKRDQDVVISMASGNRKSICFQLPGMMEVNKVTIVCSATASSIKSHIHYLKKSKIEAKSITSTMNDPEREQLTNDVAKEEPTTRFIYVTPEQATSESFNKFLQTLKEKDKLAYFAVDDAHLASQRVQDFCQDYLKFGKLRPEYPSIPWIALTHNASADVLNDIAQSLQLRKPIEKFTKSTFRKNLHYDIIFKNTLLDLFGHLQNFVTSRLETVGGNKGSGIIYCSSRERVDMVARKLTERGLATKAHHEGMTSKDRKKVLDEWKAGVLPVITTTTTSLGTGIEKSTIRVVVHFDVPQSIAGFYKESGVAGRDGKLAYCRIYYCKNDVAAVDFTLKSDIAKAQHENDKRKALRAHADFLKMTGLCETVDCRHKLFSNYFDDTEPNCNGKCDVCDEGPQLAKIGLELFYKHSAQPPCDNGRSDTLAVSPVVIKSEPGQSSEHPKPSRSVSPSNTIKLKQENDNGNRGNYSNVSDELFGMQTLPPRNVSPTRTMIKNDPDNGSDRTVQNHMNDSSACDMDNKHAIGLLSPSRSVSSTETMIDEKPVLVSNHTAPNELLSMQTMPPENVNPVNRTAIKHELDGEPRRDLMSPISQSPSTTISAGATPQCSFIKSEPKSPVRTIDKSGIEPLERAISPLKSLTAAEDTHIVPTDMVSTTTPTVTSNGTPGSSSFVVVVKQEASEKESTDNKSQRVRSPSPTETIIKDEYPSPSRNKEFDGGSLENVSDDSTNRNGKGVSERLKKKIECRRSSQGSNTNKVLPTASKNKKIPQDHNLEMHKDPSIEPEFVSREIVDFRKKNRTKDSQKHWPRRRSRSNEGFKRDNERRGRSERIKREKNVQSRSRSSSLFNERSRSKSLSRRRSRSRNNERFKRDNERRGRSERIKREKNVQSRSRSSSFSKERSRSKSLSRRRSRSRSNERFKRENDSERRTELYKGEQNVRSRSRGRSLSRERSHSKSLSRRRSRSRSNERFRRENKRERRSERYKHEKRVSRRSRSRSLSRRRSRSRSNERLKPYSSSSSKRSRKSSSERKRDDDRDRYGWEDAAPPKPKQEDEPKSNMYDTRVQEKMKEFNSKMKNEYDLDVIKAYKKELFRAIEESIPLAVKQKLNDLDVTIKKKQDDYIVNLFGTDNFNGWDDDPALSNVNNATNMQPFKALVPDDIPLYDKMSMKHVIYAMKLKPTRVGNELVFHGHITEIENQFQNQVLPRHLLESIKTEKEVIATMVKKYLLPYYNDERIQPKELFVDVARKISHIFYGRHADENIIRQYIDDLFAKYGTVISSTDLIL